jgi:hypothetical protein
MMIDWNSVKKQTLWSYEDMIEKLLNVLATDHLQYVCAARVYPEMAR